MLFVGSHEAKTRLPELFRSVERRESVTITRRGVPIARIVAVDPGAGEDTGAVIARMRRARSVRLRPSVSANEVLSVRAKGLDFVG